MEITSVEMNLEETMRDFLKTAFVNEKSVTIPADLLGDFLEKFCKYLTSKLAPHLLGPIAVAAYSYMALVPVIQPPIMKLLTTEKERKIEMKQLRSVSQREKIIFPIVITVVIAILLPSAAPLIGCLMLGNLMKECGVTERLSKTVQNELMNIVTIFLGISVGATATADSFLNWQTLGILTLGIVAFSFGSASGVILAKIMNLFSKEKINPLIGSAGVSAVPMAARVSQTVGQQYNPSNFLLIVCGRQGRLRSEAHRQLYRRV